PRSSKPSTTCSRTAPATRTSALITSPAATRSAKPKNLQGASAPSASPSTSGPQHDTAERVPFLKRGGTAPKAHTMQCSLCLNAAASDVRRRAPDSRDLRRFLHKVLSLE